jgi:hypothetical protein
MLFDKTYIISYMAFMLLEYQLCWCRDRVVGIVSGLRAERMMGCLIP